MRLIDADALNVRSYCRWFDDPDDVCVVERMIREAPTITPPPNDPLTLEQLREMDGEPVWVESCRNKKSGKYVILDGYDQALHCLRVIGGGLLDCTVMGKSWLAYRRRPEEGTWQQ